jgi:mRNA interferase RelE/StbE
VKVGYRKRFLKQLSRLPAVTRRQVEAFAFEQLPNAQSISELGVIEKMKGREGFYKCRFGSFRVGMTLESDTLVVKVVIDRKDIYKYFP